MNSVVCCLVALVVTACAGAQREWEEPTPHLLLTGPYVLITGANDAIVAFR